MSSSRIPDAASLTPFPPGIGAGRSTNAVPDSPEATRPSRSRKGAKARARPDRSSRPEEERFNIGAPRSSPSSRNSTRRSRRDRERPGPADADDAVPNYPPPSFQEAMSSSPALSICPSTLTLVSTTLASPVGTFIPSQVPFTMSSIPHQSAATSRWTPPDVSNTDPESNSDSDSSLLIIEGGTIPPDHGLPTGAELEARVREDYRNRHGVEFPGIPPTDPPQARPHFEARGRSQQRPPALDLTEIFDGPGKPQTPTLSSPKRRFMSLSPLRTIFPSKTPNAADRPQTAHPTPGVSPYMQTPKGSTFFRSTTSLATSSFLKLPLSASTTSGKSEKRRFFSKNKDKAKEPQPREALDSWEEVLTDDVPRDEAPTPSLMSVVAACQCVTPVTSASPTRSASFTYGAQAAEAYRSLHASLISHPQALASTATLAQPQPSPQPSPRFQAPPPPSPPPAPRASPPPPFENTLNSVHPLSQLDRKVPFVQRPVRRSPVPTPPRIQVPIPVPLDPVVTTVRTRLPQSATQSPPAVHQMVPRNSVTAHVARPSPLSIESYSSSAPEDRLDSSFWKAVGTPLPSTPVKAAHNPPSSPVTPSGPQPSLQAPAAAAVRSITPAPLPALNVGVSTLVRYTPPLTQQAGVFSRASSPFVEEPLTPTRHHYSGRPLPRPPGKKARDHVDSTFAPNEEYAETPVTSKLPTCPEGLLIDLDDDPLSEDAKSEPGSPAFVEDLLDLSPISEATSITPVNVLAPTPITPTLGALTFSPSFCSTPPPSSRREVRKMESNSQTTFSELTDLDVFVSRIVDDEEGMRDGSNYDVSSSPVPPSPAASHSRGEEGTTREASPAKQIQRLSTPSNEGLAASRGNRGSWESSPVQLIQPYPVQHHLPSRISWRAPGSPNNSSSNLILRPQANKYEEDDDDSDIYTNSTIEGLPTTSPSHNRLDASPCQYSGQYRQWQWQHLPARVY